MERLGNNSAGHIIAMPSQEVLEWFLSGYSGGKDGEGVAVRLNTRDHVLEPDPNFSARRDLFLRTQTGVDRYSLYEMPGLELFNMYLGGEALYNTRMHRIEPKKFTPLADS